MADERASIPPPPPAPQPPAPASPLARIEEGLIIRPGDTLIVRVEPDISQAEAEELKRGIMERLPLLASVMVIGCDQIAVMRERNASITDGPTGHRWIGQDRNG
jgi:hypothetical protein